ncbi:hypothetical protein B9Z55_006070 [Caenorhabditis nigoni]|uniref:Uncharacterized protein n=1 Tax=Caenorhabditis nigoni TaxID=1611254 RepID=A0A2G5V3N6_9PELO|nr:hypothetical protein B9Z55_006070 [Caenorhabditis nigoni]
MQTPRNQDTIETLLEHRQNEDPLENVSRFTGGKIIISVLAICGVLAVLLSSIGIWGAIMKEQERQQYATNIEQILADFRKKNSIEATNNIFSTTSFGL